MLTLKRIVPVIALLSIASSPFLANSQETVRLGTPVSESQLADFDLIAQPNGNGLPPGSGTARQGKAVYDARCAACHAANGEGISAATVIVGGDMQSEGTPLRTVGSYWPEASTVFDFVRRAMPADAPKSLSDDEVYQVVAYVLYMNGIIGEDAELNSTTLPQVEMPNADGFIDRSTVH